VFRSVVVAVKAAVMNLLSITAAYGALGKPNWWLPLALARVFMVQPERGNHVTKPLLKTGNHA
jgi:hypothetical protein